MAITWYALGRLASAQLPGTHVPGLAVDPHVVVLSQRHPAGRLTVFNPRPNATEFSIDLRFGTITTDSLGKPALRLNDDVPDTTSGSAVPWITPYPRRFILNPGTSQVIQLVAKPPRNTADGEYWARLVIHARALAAPPVATPVITRPTPDTNRHTDIHLGVAIETSTILPVFYRTGTVSTGVAIDSLTASRDSNSLHIVATLTRTGNAAYIGTATITVADPHNAAIVTIPKRVAIYETITPRWTIPLPLTAAPAHVTLLMTTNRPDAPPGTIIRATTVGKTFDLTPPPAQRLPAFAR